MIDPNEPDDYCPVCDRHLDDASSVGMTSMAAVGVDDPTSVVCLTACQHKCHAVCIKVSICRKQPHCLDNVNMNDDDDANDNNSPTSIQVKFTMLIFCQKGLKVAKVKALFGGKTRKC